MAYSRSRRHRRNSLNRYNKYRSKRREHRCEFQTVGVVKRKGFFNRIFGSIFNETYGYVNVICVKCGKEKRIGLNKGAGNF